MEYYVHWVKGLPGFGLLPGRVFTLTLLLVLLLPWVGGSAEGQVNAAAPAMQRNEGLSEVCAFTGLIPSIAKVTIW